MDKADGRSYPRGGLSLYSMLSFIHTWIGCTKHIYLENYDNYTSSCLACRSTDIHCPLLISITACT